jgi:signal transduction histidine kinase
VSQADTGTRKTHVLSDRLNPMRLPGPLRVLAVTLIYAVAPAITLFAFWCFDRPVPIDPRFEARLSAWHIGMEDEPADIVAWTSVETSPVPGVAGGEGPFMSVWYRFEVPDDRAADTFFLPNPRANIDLWLGGRRLFRSAPARRPLPYLNAPLAVPLPPGTVAQPDFLYLRSTREFDYPRPPLAYVAPGDTVALERDRILLLGRTMPLVVLGIMGAFGAAIGVLAVLRRGEPAFAWYAFTLLLWALHTLHGLIERIPFHHYVWFTLAYVLLMWVIAELKFVNRYFGLRAPRQERWLTGISALLLGATLLAALPALDDAASEARFPVFAAIVSFWFLLCALVVTSRYFVAVHRSWTYETVSLWMASGVVVGVGLRDFLYEHAPGIPIPGSVYYLQYVVMIPMALFGVALLRRFARDAHTASLRTRELEAMVQDRTQELENMYQALAEASRQRAIAEERTRLTRDMHDGLGGQLVHALALSEQGNDADLEHALRAALDDLRLIVDALSPDDRSLSEVLASYRHRSSRLLQRTGLAVDWQVDDSADSVELSPHQALNLLRVMQEAIANAVRHSGASRLRVSVQIDDALMRMRIDDNGCGIPEGVRERGLRNMRVRATELGAALRFETAGAAGTAVCLEMPVPDGPAAVRLD